MSSDIFDNTMGFLDHCSLANAMQRSVGTVIPSVRLSTLSHAAIATTDMRQKAQLLL